MKIDKFTKEELYFIEMNFDHWTTHTSREFRDAAYKAVLLNAHEKIPNEITKTAFEVVGEFVRSLKLAKSIRDKCEAHRTNK